MEKTEKRKQGKRNKRAGREFESLVRKDLESKGWIVSKWCNTIEEDKIVAVKPKFNPFTKRLMMMSGGFPDFIAFQSIKSFIGSYVLVGVESKSNGSLDAKEKKMCRFYLDNKIFHQIKIARKGKERGEIEYRTFGESD